MGVREDLLAISGVKHVPAAAIAAAVHGDTDLRTAINRLIGFIDEQKHGITRGRSAKVGLLAQAGGLAGASLAPRTDF